MHLSCEPTLLFHSSSLFLPGLNKVSIFLQPSWTWGDVGTRHFEADSIRTVENGICFLFFLLFYVPALKSGTPPGFTLIRCTSDGESGIVGPSGIVSSREYTGHNPVVSQTFDVQLNPRVDTIYPWLGFAFEWICAIFSLFTMISGTIFHFIYSSKFLFSRQQQRANLLSLCPK